MDFLIHFTIVKTENAKKAATMGCMNIRWLAPRNLGDSAMIVIMVAPGKAQASNDKNAISGPPCFHPKMVMVCVVDGPGKRLQNALTSVSVSTVKKRCLSTNLLLNCGMCICGPPKAVSPSQKTERRNLICLAFAIFVV